MQENVCKKYGISREELQIGVDEYYKIATGKFSGDISILCAILDLLCVGDIPATTPKFNFIYEE